MTTIGGGNLSQRAIYCGVGDRLPFHRGAHHAGRHAIVFVVDDDVSVRESLELLIKSAGWQPETFVSAQEFLSRPRPRFRVAWCST